MTCHCSSPATCFDKLHHSVDVLNVMNSYTVTYPVRINNKMRSLIPLALITTVLGASVPAQNFVNTAIARTVELGGAITQVTTQYNVKALVDSPGEYHLALGGEEDALPAWWEVSIAGKAVEDLVAVTEG